MTRRIFKYRVPVGPGVTVVDDWYDGVIRSLQLQEGVPTLWVEVDDKSIPWSRCFAWHGTGHELPANPGTYIGTVQLPNGLVFHLYG